MRFRVFDQAPRGKLSRVKASPSATSRRQFVQATATATALHLLGVGHERLTFYHNGVQRRLTGGHGQVLREILA